MSDWTPVNYTQYDWDVLYSGGWFRGGWFLVGWFLPTNTLPNQWEVKEHDQ